MMLQKLISLDRNIFFISLASCRVFVLVVDILLYEVVVAVFSCCFSFFPKWFQGSYKMLGLPLRGYTKIR